MENQEMEKKNTNKKGNIVIIVLAVLVLALAGYIVYDKVITKSTSKSNSKNNSSANIIDDSQPNNFVVENNDNEKEEEKKEETKEETKEESKEESKKEESKTVATGTSVLDSKCYRDLVPVVERIVAQSQKSDGSDVSSLNLDGYNKKSEDFIRATAFQYFIRQLNYAGASTYNKDNERIDVYVYKSALDDFARMAFNVNGLSDYSYNIQGRGRTGINKISDNLYGVNWYGTSGSEPELKNIVITKDGNNSYMTIDVYYGYIQKTYEGKIKVTFTEPKEGTTSICGITKIEQVK